MAVLAVLQRLRRTAGEAGTVLRIAAQRFWDDNCFQTASALAYTSLIAMVPLTTILLGILSAFPAFQEVRQNATELIFETLVPQVGQTVLDYLESFAAAAGQLTTFGVIGLMITSVLLLSTIESSFNHIWRVREARPLPLRVLSFWAVLTMTPLLFGASLSLTNQIISRTDLGGDGEGWRLFVGVLPAVFEFVGFTLIYWLIPNRWVRLRDAAVGGAVAAVLFEISKTGFAMYLTAYPIYQTIYGAVSTIPIFLLWLYLGWTIVLVGAVIAASLPDWRSDKLLGAGPEGLLPAQRILIACGVLHELMTASRLGIGIRHRTLMRRLPIGGTLLEGTLDQLRQARFIARTADDKWLLSRDLSVATLYDLAKSMGIGLRGSAHATIGGVKGLSGDWQGRVTATLEATEQENREVMGPTLASLLEDEPAAVPIRLEKRR